MTKKFFTALHVPLVPALFVWRVIYNVIQIMMQCNWDGNEKLNEIAEIPYINRNAHFLEKKTRKMMTIYITTTILGDFVSVTLQTTRQLEVTQWSCVQAVPTGFTLTVSKILIYRTIQLLLNLFSLTYQVYLKMLIIGISFANVACNGCCLFLVATSHIYTMNHLLLRRDSELRDLDPSQNRWKNFHTISF